MAEKSTTALETPLRDQLDRLAALPPGSFISLYLDLRPDHNGQRNHVQTFLKNSFDEQLRTMTGDTHVAFENTLERIRGYVNSTDLTATRALAMFASTTGDVFEAIIACGFV